MMKSNGIANYAAHAGQGETSEEEDDDQERPDPFPYSESEDIPLPEDYTPTKHDVINGRGRKSYNHVANRRFRQLIAVNLDRYLAARCKVDKTLVVVGIVNTIRNANPIGGFLKRCPKRNRWISLSDESAREKVGHCLRDMIASHREDSKKLPSKSASSNTGDVPAAERVGVETVHQLAPPGNNPWVHRQVKTRKRTQESSHRTRDAPFANMWSVVKNEISTDDTRKASSLPPLLGPISTADVPRSTVPFGVRNMDTITLQKGNLQDMSEQQRKILMKLENGFKGTVEELMESVK